jgi:nucleotide-binding universal stress UspA family protein
MAHIVVGVDGSPHADDALRWAVREAGIRSGDVEVLHAYVIEVHRGAAAASSRSLADETLRRALERNADVLADVKWESSLAPVMGRPLSTPLVRAGEDAELLVVGSRGLGGFRELLLGSTSYRTAAHAPCPVAVVQGAPDADLDQPVVVGFDDSRAARRALQWAVDEAALRAVDAVAVHGYVAPPTSVSGVTVQDPAVISERERARSEADGLADRVLAAVDVPQGVAVRRRVVAGTPAGAVLHHAAEGQLVVVGSRGHGAIGRALVGSVSHQVLHHAVGTVVVVP